MKLPFHLAYVLAMSQGRLTSHEPRSFVKRQKLAGIFTPDRISADGRQPLISFLQVVETAKRLMGYDKPLPEPMLPKNINREIGPGHKQVEQDLHDMFTKYLDVPHPCRQGLKKGPGKGRHEKNCSYTKAEVSEWMWSIIVSYLDAKALAPLPRTQPFRSSRDGKSQQHVVAEWGNGWPQSDIEWRNGANVIISLLHAADDSSATYSTFCQGSGSDNLLGATTDPLLSPVAIEEVMEYIRESIVHAVGVSIDRDLLQQHFSPLCLSVEPSLFLAKTLVRSSILEELIGNTLATVVRRRQVESDWAVHLGANEDDLLRKISQELTDTRQHIAVMKTEAARGNFKELTQMIGPSLTLVDPVDLESPRITWREQRVQAQKLKIYEEVCGFIGTNATCLANARLSQYYRDLALNGFSSKAIEHLQFKGNERKLRESILNYDEAVELHTKDMLMKASFVLFLLYFFFKCFFKNI